MFLANSEHTERRLDDLYRVPVENFEAFGFYPPGDAECATLTLERDEVVDAGSA